MRVSKFFSIAHISILSVLLEFNKLQSLGFHSDRHNHFSFLAVNVKIERLFHLKWAFCKMTLSYRKKALEEAEKNLTWYGFEQLVLEFVVQDKMQLQSLKIKL